ncbi:MAG: tetratricopeptide repeat protein [Saprospiraceae bacterium]|nr:tetratricopeptide repeat protein [Saprospiraceae bacterium]
MRNRQGQYAKATPDFQALIALEPQNGQACSRLVESLIREGRHIEAQELADRAIQLTPQSVTAHYHHSLLDGHNGRIDSACAHLEKALRMGWTDQDAVSHDPELSALRAQSDRW